MGRTFAVLIVIVGQPLIRLHVRFRPDDPKSETKGYGSWIEKKREARLVAL